MNAYLTNLGHGVRMLVTSACVPKVLTNNFWCEWIHWFGRCLDADVEWYYKLIRNPNWRVYINQSQRVVTGQSLSHINGIQIQLIYSTSKNKTKARSYFAVYSNNGFSAQFNNDVNTNVTRVISYYEVLHK